MEVAYVIAHLSPCCLSHDSRSVIGHRPPPNAAGGRERTRRALGLQAPLTAIASAVLIFPRSLLIADHTKPTMDSIIT